MRPAVPALIILLTAAASAQTPAPAEPAKPGKVAGIVVNRLTGDPIRKAEVHLAFDSDESEEKERKATTDDEGRFVFEDVAAGSYNVHAVRTGFGERQYGTKHSRKDGDITVSAGSTTTVVLRLIPTAVITGRVYDEDGEPLANASVRAMRYRYHRGKRQLQPMESGHTNDLGEYRIAGLTPGSHYFLAANYSGDAPVQGDQKRAYGQTYYPHMQDPAQAQEITLQPGDEARFDFTLVPQPAYRVRGTVVDNGTPKAAETSVMLVPDSDDFNLYGFTSFGNRQQVGVKDGAFEFEAVSPGAYRLMAVAVPENMDTTKPNFRMAMQDVNVGEHDVDGLQIVLAGDGGAEIKGKVTFEGERPANKQLMAMLLPADLDLASMSPADMMGMGRTAAMVAADGTFTMPSVPPGQYRAQLGGEEQFEDFYIRSIRYGGREASQEPIVVSEGRGAFLEIVFSKGGAVIEGSVADATGKPFKNAFVVALPAGSIAHRLDAHERASTDRNGRFSMKGVVAGEYRLYAFDRYGAHEAVLDKQFVQRYEKEGKTVRVSEKGSASAELRLIELPDAEFE